ncbi:MAG TPA: hypothetical protein VKU00_32725 [Chthonomonadaceae bacterium]|nr:hypothetical protein [Chthonomonadaceae bacterium]
MGTAYTPGLKVSAGTTIERLRRLPLKGRVLVEVGQTVAPDTVVASTELPGILQTVKLAERMGIEPTDLAGALRVQVGDTLRVGDVMAESKGLFGRFFRSEFKSPVAGVVEFITPKTGHVGVRQAPTPVTKDAYIRGVISKVIPEEGVVVTCQGALVQGIFGVGGERQGEIALVTKGPEEPLTEASLSSAHAGKIVVGGSTVSAGALHKAAALGVIGIVCGGVVDRDLMDYLALALNQPDFDIGVAITGHEPIPFTLVLTEGFGTIAMAQRTFSLLRSLEGKVAAINGATQIRAGVIRPEIIVPLDNPSAAPSADGEPSSEGQLSLGSPIRVIREPYFGLLGSVTALPPELVQVESETMVRVLEAQLADGRRVTVPRANVELIEVV